MTASSSIHSNAFNFLSFVDTGTDPRTGQYTCSLSLPELNANQLSGPQVPLRLGYNPLNTLDSGFGKGWNLQLTQYDADLQIVSLASGETFKVTSTSSDGKRLLMDEQKLDSFRLYQDDDHHYRVVHKSGLVEELSRDDNQHIALPERILSPQGQHVTLTYQSFGDNRLLKRIANADGSLLLDITRGTSVQVRLHPGTVWEALFSLVLQGSEGRVMRVELPTSNLASWRFGYEVHEDLLCISRVEGPLGGHEQVFYNGGSHLFPGDDNRRLPRVSRHVRYPGAEQPPIETRYQYDGNNFLGRNAPDLVWDNNGKDNLYRVLSDYTYWTTEQLWDTASNSARRSITRTFNRFHLITEELTRQGDCVKRVTTDYPVLAGQPFEQQPAQCQLPASVTSAWYLHSEPGHVREDVVTTTYDEHGNLVLRVEANGVSETSEYYPAAGEDGCPADPHGFVRHLKSRTVTPAAADYGDAPVLRSSYRYIALPPISGGSHEWLAQSEETLSQVQGNLTLQHTRQHYFDQPADAFLHGRISMSEEVLDGLATVTNFFYSKAQAQRADETVLRTVEVLSTSFDNSSKTITRERSLLNGQPLLELDDNDVQIAYVYDSLGRVTEEIVAPGDKDYEARRKYEYVLVAQFGGQASQTAIDVKGVATRSDLDGLQRVVGEWRQDVDGDPQLKPLRQVYAARYDLFGQLSASDEIDWLDEETLTLTSTYTYDDWGEQSGVTGPDGVTAHSQNDPVNFKVEEWRDGVGRSVTRSNRFDKPDSVERLDLAGKPYSRHEYFYDGLGRTHHEFDALRNLTAYEYDAFDRMTLNILPDGARVERRYARHSREDLPVWIGVNGVVLGEQVFDGLGRRTGLSVGPRHETYVYKASQVRPSEHHTAGGHTLLYGYTPHLSSSPTSLSALDEEARYTYDRANARLTSASNLRGCREFDYDGCSHLSAERWIENGQTWSASYSHSRAGRRRSHTDVNGLETTYQYDLCGRLRQLTQGRLQVEYCYDAFSRLHSSTCHDLDAGTSVTTTLGYDDWGRETERTLQASGQPAQTIILEYRRDDSLHSRHLRRAGTMLLLEGFDYDKRGRLTDYLCSGTQPPRDRYGNAIAAQYFQFDTRDNLFQVDTHFTDKSEDICTRTFASDDPCRLVHISHSHGDYPAALDLNYDADGNLRVDEEGRTLHYDSQSRLMQVDDRNGQVLCQYHYDAHNQLCGETRGGAGQMLRFYQGDRLGCTVQGQSRVSYLHEGDRPLGQQQLGQPGQTLLLLTGANNSVLGESQQQSLREATYGAWGERSGDEMQCPLGFNGEIRERDTGWYLLGNGYRAYNPSLMCFHSPDSMSPFAAGGINPYTYCVGNPITLRDPTGHFVQGWLGWTGLALGVAGTLMSIGAASAAFGVLLKGTANLGQVMTAVSFTSGVAATGMQVGAALTDDRHTQSVLGIGAHIAGWVSLVSGFGGYWQRGWKWRPQKGSGNADSVVSSRRTSMQSSYEGIDDGLLDWQSNLTTQTPPKPFNTAQQLKSMTSLPEAQSPLPTTPSRPASPALSRRSSLTQSVHSLPEAPPPPMPPPTKPVTLPQQKAVVVRSDGKPLGSPWDLEHKTPVHLTNSNFQYQFRNPAR